MGLSREVGGGSNVGDVETAVGSGTPSDSASLTILGSLFCRCGYWATRAGHPTQILANGWAISAFSASWWHVVMAVPCDALVRSPAVQVTEFVDDVP